MTNNELNVVSVIDTTTNTQVAFIQGFSCPSGIAIVQLAPRNKDDCKNGGYQRFGALGFRNQGQCVKYVNEHQR